MQFEANRNALMMEALRNVQGLHMPMRLQMERRIVAKVCSHVDEYFSDCGIGNNDTCNACIKGRGPRLKDEMCTVGCRLSE